MLLRHAGERLRGAQSIHSIATMASAVDLSSSIDLSLDMSVVDSSISYNASDSDEHEIERGRLID